MVAFATRRMLCLVLALAVQPAAAFTASFTGMPDQTADASAVATDKPSWLESVELAAAHLTEENLKVAGLGCAVAGGILCLCNGPAQGAGWVVSGGVMAWSSRLVAKQRLTNGLAKTAKQLAVQNHELTADLSALKSVVNKFGHSASDIEELVKTLGQTWSNYQRENDRHAELLDSQARLQLLQLMQQFDADRDSSLDAGEQRAAEAYLRATFPQADLAGIGQDASLSLRELEMRLLANKIAGHLANKEPAKGVEKKSDSKEVTPRR